MSKGKGQQAMEHNWSPLEFQLPDGKDALQTAQKCYQSKIQSSRKCYLNSKPAPTQVETVLTTPNDTLIGMPTTVTDLLIVETPLAKATELAPVDACINLL